ncbi:hypothetical protein GTY81_20105 [Streptomyces sp. SID8366]|uniref:hypothetical protein n=1 Tax=unclassified Streptomyces TaxID=2593676 RepID=UPI000DB9A200|nr:hypothetical protein [Streptomyces sp. PsTaAH-130]MYU06137.1 hypothetical protein [Streptomyces sp. SID8366]MYU61711.1 hypothetical protein [Streptomyces sp. SID69]RAJ64209.1 hypothetical protein K376_01306 [Streptomyces sp. PsTaAH-130]
MDAEEANAVNIRATPLAPLPDHPDVNTSWWQELWRLHAHITTPLRQRGLMCDIEFGTGTHTIHVSLPDDSYLVIGPAQETSSDRPPGDPGGWIVTRHSDEPQLFEVLYDSAPSTDPGVPDRAEAHHGGSAIHLIGAIDQRLSRLGLLPAPFPHTGDPLMSTAPQPPAPAAPGPAGTRASAYVYGDAILALTDQLNGTNAYADAAVLLHQIGDPINGLLERLADFVEAAGEKARESEDDDGFDLSYDLADAAADIRTAGEVLFVAEDRMRALSPPPPPRPSAAPSRTPPLASPGLPPAQSRRTR